MDFHFAVDFAVGVHPAGPEIGVAQHAVADRIQPEPGEVHPVHRHGGDHVHAGPRFDIGGQRRCVAHRMVHALHARHSASGMRGMVHHPHVRHGQRGDLAQGGRGGDMPLVTGQAGDAHAAAVHGLGNDGMAAGGRTDDDVVCLGHTDLEFIDFDFVHVLAVGLDHRHRNAGNTQIEEGHGRPVDDP